VQLVAADGTLSAPVAASDFIDLVGPFGTPDADLSFINPAFPDGFHINMPTARIPMDNFQFDQLNQTRGIRFTFDATATGKIYLANLRASRRGVSSLAGAADPASALDAANQPNANVPVRVIDQGNVIEDARQVAVGGAGAAKTGNQMGTVRF